MPTGLLSLVTRNFPLVSSYDVTYLFECESKLKIFCLKNQVGDTEFHRRVKKLNNLFLLKNFGLIYACCLCIGTLLYTTHATPVDLLVHPDFILLHI